MTCNDCIHDKVCSKPYYGNNIACNNVEELCENFKNKADFEEVVRCEKCVDYLYDTLYCKKNNIGYCDRDGAIKQKNHFCSYGERKDAE